MKQILNEKYRPKNLEDYVFSNEEHRQSVEKWVAEKSIPHLLFHGHRGTGKTTLAYILRDLTGVDPSDFLEINSSSSGNVETIRDLVHNFVSTVAHGTYKIVLLDEVDGMSKQAQKALRGIVQDNSDNARFILTCNNVNLVDSALRSRCQELKYKSVDKETMLMRLAEIVTLENIKTTADNLEAYVERFYPDFRKLLESVDQNTFNGSLRDLEDASDDGESECEIVLFEMIEGNQFNTRYREALSSVSTDEDWANMYRFLFDNLHEMGKFAKDKEKWEKGIFVIADAAYKHEIVADPEINGAAMLLKLGRI